MNDYILFDGILVKQEDFLMHHGVAGMKWGHRKQKQVYKKVKNKKKQKKAHSLNKNKEIDFYDTNEYQNALDKAYKKTYSWFEKKAPNTLNEFIKNNKGRKDDLYRFHDFRKMLEGYEDVEISKAEKEWTKK